MRGRLPSTSVSRQGVFSHLRQTRLEFAGVHIEGGVAELMRNERSIGRPRSVLIRSGVRSWRVCAAHQQNWMRKAVAGLPSPIGCRRLHSDDT